jgi:hypothetical protein
MHNRVDGPPTNPSFVSLPPHVGTKFCKWAQLCREINGSKISQATLLLSIYLHSYLQGIIDWSFLGRVQSCRTQRGHVVVPLASRPVTVGEIYCMVC